MSSLAYANNNPPHKNLPINNRPKSYRVICVINRHHFETELEVIAEFNVLTDAYTFWQYKVDSIKGGEFEKVISFEVHDYT